MSNWEGVDKAELHVHLFGAIPPRVLLELARRHRVALAADTVEGLRQWFQFSDFASFKAAFVTLRPCVQTVDDLELIGREFARELAGQRVRYAEVMVSPAAVADRGIDISRQLEVLDRVRLWACDELDVDLRWIFDIIRSLPDPRERRHAADLTLEAALAGRARGVVALGLSAAEAGYPPEQFAPWFERARAAGLHSVPHAGEHAGPESVWGAIRALGADRIAHGVRAIEHPALVSHLAEHGIPLDVCPTSNVRLGVCPSLAEHPLRRLMAAGVPVTINSDNPTMFGVTLNDEVAMLSTEQGLDDGAISEVLANPPHEAGFAGTPDGFRFGFETHAVV